MARKAGICCKEMYEAVHNVHVALPWLHEHTKKPLLTVGGGYFRFCPYCGEDLSEYYDEEAE